MDDDETKMNILKGLAEGMERNADRIAKEEQLIRDAFQPLGRIMPEKEQEYLITITASLLENIKHIREIAARFRKMEY